MTDRAVTGDAPPGVAPGGQSVVDDLVALLDLEQIELNIFRGVSPTVSLQRVFGGQVAGQALVAAGRTVDPERRVHSLHSYFLRGGDPGVPIVYMTDRLRDGRSFSVRRVVAVQHGEPIFILSASFQLDQPGIEHATSMPDVPAPETLPTLADRYRGFEEILGPLPRLPRPFDLRYVDDPPWIQRATGPRESGAHRIWMRADGELPEDQLINICALTFASDLTLLDSVLTRHGLSWGFDPLVIASLDHAMWFHRPFRADRWFLYDTSSPTASGSRGLSEGRFFAEDGTQIATVMQEGMIRLGY